MKIGIDSYCFHRFFGEVYPGQEEPKERMTMDDFLDLSKKLGVDGVSLESCFFPSFDESYLKDLKAKLDAYGFQRVYAWGHPSGLEAGKSKEAFLDLCQHIPRAKAIGADVMRICGSSSAFLHEPRQPQITALITQCKEAMIIADEYQVKLAIENHHDFTANEILQIVEGVGHPHFGITFDTGNFLRLLDDPIKAMEKLAKHTFATHIKDLHINPTAHPDDWFFFSGVPIGRGLVNNTKLAKLLKEANYQGLLAIELDYPHLDWAGCEEEVVSMSVKTLRNIATSI